MVPAAPASATGLRPTIVVAAGRSGTTLLMSLLREQGVEKVSEVKRAYVEGDGRISVIPFDAEKHQADERVGSP